MGASNRDRAFRQFLKKTADYEFFLLGGRPMQFVRPLRSGWVRVRDVGTNEKHTVQFTALQPVNELDVLAYMIDDNPNAEAPEPDEPQEEADLIPWL